MKDNNFDIVCCPKCHSNLAIRDEFLFCNVCFKEYLIKDNICVLLD